FKVAVRVFDMSKKAFVRLQPSAFSPDPINRPLVSFDPSIEGSHSLADIHDDQFKLTTIVQKRIRIYENRLAVPAAYLVHSLVAVKDGNEALKEIKKPNFDLT